MRLQKVLFSACILGMLYMRCCFAVSSDIPEQKIDNNEIKITEAIPPVVEQARNKALYAQRIAVVASRMALKAEKNARFAILQIKTGRAGYNVVTNDQGYHYEGEWKNNLPNNMGYNGFGALSWPNGNRYEGEFLNGHKNGSGVFIGGNGDRYEGAFLGGEIDGYGSYAYPNGDYYQGEYHRNYRYGYGVMMYPNGDRYEGEWRDNEKHGYGILLSFDGTVKYAGSW